MITVITNSMRTCVKAWARMGDDAVCAEKPVYSKFA